MERKRILLVDDEEPVRRLLSGVLAAFDYEVDTAENGREGVRKAQAHRYDLVILDWLMPRLDGPEAIAELRAHPATAHLPVIVLTARATREAVIQAAGAGADYVFAKSGFNLELFLQKVDQALRSARPRGLELPDWLGDSVRKLGLDPVEDLKLR